MKTVSKTRRFLTVAFAFTALAAGAYTATQPANATLYCHWTAAHGTVCNPG